MDWINDGYSSVKEIVLNNTGLSEQEFFNIGKTFSILNLEKAADKILDCISSNKKIYIFGDYDADGITSTTEMVLLLEYLIAKAGSSSIVIPIFPERSKGYGVSIDAIKTMDDNEVLITIDNGIAAIEQIRYAKEQKHMTVIVLDHHLLNDKKEIPIADVIVDPAEFNTGFGSYCAAGIAYKLAVLLVGNDKEFLGKLSVFAAIGTIADVMPLIYDNRNIVIEGLNNIKRGNTTEGIAALIEAAELYKVDEEDIGFKIGPMINAPERMMDGGSKKLYNLFVSKLDYANLLYMANELAEINNKRKIAVLEAMKKARLIMAENCLYGNIPLCINGGKDISAGIAGIIAGRLAEEFKTPAFVLSDVGSITVDNVEHTLLKGSGRSFGGVHLKNLLDKIPDTLYKYGGHEGAAGLSVLEKKYYEMENFMIEELSNVELVDADPDILHYDKEIDASQVPDIYKEQAACAPYGNGNPKPIFCIRNVSLSPRQGKFCRFMGDNAQHVKLFGKDLSLVAFDQADRYREDNMPLLIDVVGKISLNRFRNVEEYQVEILDYKAVEHNEVTSLQAMINARMASF